MKLTPKQERFVQEYLGDLNATAAAKRAGYSAKNADKIGSELLGKTRVSEALQKAMQERSQRTEVTQDYVIGKLKAIADKKASDAPDSELKYSSQIKAIELLGKHMGLFDKRLTVDLGESAAKAVSSAAEREVLLERMMEVISSDDHGETGKT